MTQAVYLAKLGELTLKKSNRHLFEKRLTENLRAVLRGRAEVTLRSGRLYVECAEQYAQAVEFALDRLIGITGWARAIVCEKEIQSITQAVYQTAVQAQKEGAQSFKIETRRADKTFMLNSYEISCEAAATVCEEKLLSVDLHKPDVLIRIELREQCFVYRDGRRSCRGLPVGTGGRGLLLLSGGIDSPVAGYRMMRRGMKIDCIYFHAYPYTSDEAKKKVCHLARLLANYGLETRLYVIPFTAVQLRIQERAPEAFMTMLLRMCMMRAANILCNRIQADCLISGESLGQVASQTIENLSLTESVAEKPLLRPLIGLDKEEITETAKQIGTYEISILPYEDCCVLFSPRHPVLKTDKKTAYELYARLEADSLIMEAFEERETVRFSAREYLSDLFPPLEP